MNIVLAGHFGFPTGSAGASRVRHMALGLSRLDHQVSALAMSPLVLAEGQQPEGPRWYEYLSVRYYSAAGWMPNVRSPAEKLRVQYRRLHGAQTAALAELDRLHAHEGVDAILGYSGGYFGIQRVAAWARRRSVPLVRDVVEWWQPYSFAGGRLNPVYWNTWLNANLGLPRSDGIIAISSTIARRFMDMGLPTIRVPAIIDPEKWAFEPMPVRDRAEPFRLMYLGDMNQRDVPVIMIQALRKVLQRGCNVVLDVVGGVKFEGPAQEARELCERDPVLNGRVTFYGRVSDEEVRKRFAAAHALLFTRRAGRTAQAAFPTRLPEFLMTRRPVISTAIGDIPEYLPDGQAAIMVQPESVDGLAEGITRVMDLPDEGRAIGEAGRSACLEHFDYLRRCRQIVEFIEQLAATKRPSGRGACCSRTQRPMGTNA